MLGKIAKWTAATVCAAYIGYSHARKMDHTLLEVKYAAVKAEQPFLPKDHALSLRISYQRNDKGNLETYLESFNQKRPLYLRENGIVLGDSRYLWNNIPYDDRAALCKEKTNPPPAKKETTNGITGTFQRIFEIFTGDD